MVGRGCGSGESESCPAWRTQSVSRCPRRCVTRSWNVRARSQARVMSGQGSRTWRSPSSSSVLRSFRRHMIHEIDGVVAERVEVCVWPGSCRGSPAREGPVGVHESVDVGVTLVRSMIRTRGGSAGGNSVIATVATRGTGSPRRRFPCTLTRDGTGSWQRRCVWSPFRRVGHWAGTIKPRAIPADVRRTRRVCTAWFGSAPSGSTGHGVAAGAVRTALAA
jgi:hypothetical protein